METTERIVEAYVRYVKGWATIPNVRCAGQNEIDLVAIDPVSLARYHIEVSISISQGFRKLTAMPFDAEKVKQRVHQASQRRTVGFFAERKFNAPTVVERLRQLGFELGAYTRIIVTWGWTEDAAKEAMAAEIELWDFRDMIREVAEAIRGSREYFTDDTLRTLNPFIHAIPIPNSGDSIFNLIPRTVYRIHLLKSRMARNSRSSSLRPNPQNRVKYTVPGIPGQFRELPELHKDPEKCRNFLHMKVHENNGNY